LANNRIKEGRAVKAIFIATLFLLSAFLYANTVEDDLRAVEQAAASQQDFSNAVDAATIGGFSGLIFGTLFPAFQTSITTTTPETSTWTETSPTTGKWTTIPAFTTVSSVPNGWGEVGCAIAGMALSVGIYELGHKILKWW
jgi:hypothetical protein